MLLKALGNILAKIYLFFIKHLAKFTIKFHGTINEPLPLLPGNEQDLGHENIVKTCFTKNSLPMHRSHDISASDISA